MSGIRRFTEAEVSEMIDRRKRGESINTIAAALGRRKESVWYQVKDIHIPIEVRTEERKRQFRSRGMACVDAVRKKWATVRKARIEAASSLWKVFGETYRRLPSTIKGKIAETATLLRLLLLEAEVFHPACEYGACDWLVKMKGSVHRIQVRATSWHSGPGSGEFVNACSRQGTSKLTKADCDFIVGYSILDDACYIIPIKDIKKRTIPAKAEYRERWDLLA